MVGAGCLGVLLFFFVFWCCVCVYVFVPFALSGGVCVFVVGVLGVLLVGCGLFGVCFGCFLGFWGWFLPVFGVVFWCNGFGWFFGYLALCGK